MGEKWAYHLQDHFREKRADFVQSRKSRGELVKLHLGCGKKIFRGYVNIDNYGEPDVLCDIMSLPYEANSVDEIIAIHVYEHIVPWKVEETTQHWFNILKPGAKLILEMPDLVKVLGFFKQEKPPLSHTMYALYGGEPMGRVEDLHKWCWTFKTIEPLLKKVGFTEIVEKTAQYHFPERDFRVEATK